MDARGQFTFYRSFWDAIRCLPKKDRLPILEAIISYALDGTEPASLTQSQTALFSLIRPNLDASRKKAKSGKTGGSVKQTASKPEANDKQTESKSQAPVKQTASEKEKEKEKEIEIEGEEEKEKKHPALLCDGKLFTSFFDAYPNKRKRDAAWEQWKAINPDQATVEKIMAALAAWKHSTQWTEDGGRFIPLAANFLGDSGYWLSPPTSAPPAAPATRQLDEDEQRAIQRMLNEGIPDAPGDPHKEVRP